MMPFQPVAGAAFRTVPWSGPKEISLRERCHGGPVRERPIESPLGALQRSRHVVLLIHGFNVDFCGAERSYTNFVKELFFRWQARTFWVYWPGDAAPESERGFARWTRPMVSALSYPYQPNTALSAAEKLRDHIQSAIDFRKSRGRGPIRLSIIAHSLGCRLTLELLRLLGSPAGLEIDLVVLMAAAVPMYHVQASGIYDLARIKAKKTLIYFSGADRILKAFFRPGQRFESTGPNNFFVGRGALGRRGLHGIPPPGVEAIERSHDHSDYWPDHSISVRVALELDGNRRPMGRRALLPRGFEAPRTVPGRRVVPREIRLTASECNCGTS